MMRVAALASFFTLASLVGVCLAMAVVLIGQGSFLGVMVAILGGACVALAALSREMAE